jgi:hypothetical protein
MAHGDVDDDEAPNHRDDNLLSFCLTVRSSCIKNASPSRAGLTPSPTCPPGKVASAKAGWGRTGNKRDQPRRPTLLMKGGQ